MTLAGYAEHLPLPALRDHVASYWTRDSRDLRAHRVLPDGCMDVVFELAAGVAEVVGIITRALVVREARDRALAIDDVWGRDGCDLAERLADVDPASRLRVLDGWLLDRKLRARFAEPRVRAAVRILEATRGAASVRELARRAGVGERQLERAFDERVGVGPKALARAIRLQSFVAALDRRGAATIAAVAAEAGFADEPHLVREMKALAGVTPRELYRERMSDSFKSATDPPLTLAG